MISEYLINSAILAELGAALRQERINQNMSTPELSKKSGVSMRTISGFERGEKNISLVNLIELMRALQKVNNLNNLIPRLPAVSPIQMMKIEMKKRKRVKK